MTQPDAIPDSDLDRTPTDAPTTPRPGRAGEPGGEWLPIAEAARRLRLSRDGALKRVRLGRLTGRKQGDRWYVRLGTDQLEPPAAAFSDQSGVLMAERLRVADERNQELRAEVAFLRSQVEAHQRQLDQAATERAELRRLLGNAQMQAAALPAGAAQSTAAAEHQPPLTPQGQAREDAAAGARYVRNEPAAASQPLRERSRPWWRRWLG